MTHEINFHELAKLSPEQRAKLQQRTETDLSAFEAKARPIIAAVRAVGDEALARFARDFDKADVKASEIAATESDFAAAEKGLDPKVREGLDAGGHRGVVGRTAGTVADFNYSKAVKSSGVVWSEETLDKWLTNPQAFIPGQRMNFRVIDPADRADLIAYLKTLTLP